MAQILSDLIDLETETLYHGSSIAPGDLEWITAVDNDYEGNTRFGVFFTTDRLTAEKYGYYIYELTIPAESEIEIDETECESFYIDENIYDFEFAGTSNNHNQKLNHKVAQMSPQEAELFRLNY